MFPFGGALTWSEVGPRPVISQPIRRCDWLKPCVAAPGRTSTTSAMEVALGVFTVKVAPWPTVAGELVMTDRARK